MTLSKKYKKSLAFGFCSVMMLSLLVGNLIFYLGDSAVDPVFHMHYQTLATGIFSVILIPLFAIIFSKYVK